MTKRVFTSTEDHKSSPLALEPGSTNEDTTKATTKTNHSAIIHPSSAAISYTDSCSASAPTVRTRPTSVIVNHNRNLEGCIARRKPTACLFVPSCYCFDVRHLTDSGIVSRHSISATCPDAGKWVSTTRTLRVRSQLKSNARRSFQRSCYMERAPWLGREDSFHQENHRHLILPDSICHVKTMWHCFGCFDNARSRFKDGV